MNHKRGKPKSSRSGCLFCKPHKRQGCKKDKAKVAAKIESLEEQIK